MKAKTITVLTLTVLIIYGLIILTKSFTNLSDSLLNESIRGDSKLIQTNELNCPPAVVINKCSNENKVSEAQLPEEPKIIIKEVPKEVIRYVNSGEGTDIENVRSIEFLRKNWETIYDQKIASIYNNYSPETPGYVPPPPSDPKYSKMYVNNTNGIYWGYVYNACWNMKSKELELYQNPDNEQDLPEKIPPKGYTQLWKMKRVESPMPEGIRVDENEGNWMLIPVISVHCSHFMETYNFLIHAFLHPRDYPYIRTIYDPLFNIHGERGCNTEYMNIVNSIRPKSFAVTTVRQHEMSNMVNQDRVCFRKLVSITPLASRRVGASLFSSTFAVDCVRAQAYKRFSIDLPTRRPAKFEAVLIEREKSRHRGILNREDIDHYFYVKSGAWNYHYFRIEKYQVSQQVKMAVTWDLVIAVHGGALAVIVYMLPHSCVIELRPPYFRDRWYYINSRWSRINLIPLSNLTSVPPKPCANVPFERIGSTLQPECFKVIHYASSYVNMNDFNEHMNEILVTLDVEKYSVFRGS